MIAVVDLGYGDAGKGTVVDYLVRRYERPVVVRFNGGPQASHNVVLPDGTHHAFSTWGSGTLYGALTYLAKPVLVNPLAALQELRELKTVGVPRPLNMLSAHPDCAVITPWHVTENRLREEARGPSRHGSCGQGIGATAADRAAGRVLRLSDLLTGPLGIELALEKVRARKMERLRREIGARVEDLPSWPMFNDIDRGRVVNDYWRFARSVKLTSTWTSGDSVIFEGAQGMLIDQQHGAFPHVTYSDCTFNQPDHLCLDRYGERPVHLGVSRTYMVRHGPGPFPTEDPDLDHLPEPHNERGQWQGRVRRGRVNFERLHHAVRAAGGIDALALTHVDLGMPGYPLETDPVKLFARELYVSHVLVSRGPTHQDKTFTLTGENYEDDHGNSSAHRVAANDSAAD